MEPNLSALAYDLQALLKTKNQILVGIDGCGGAGKSTFAETLQDKGDGCFAIIHMDDFYKPASERGMYPNTEIGGEYDWRRLKVQVIEPLLRGVDARYQRYDWTEDQLSDWQTTRFGTVVLIEGVYSTRNELADFYDFRIWIDCPREIRLSRGLERDGEAARARWEQAWMPAEDRYMETHTPRDRANLIVNGVMA